MIKWFNKQKPVTLAFITALTTSIMILVLSQLALIDLNDLEFIKFNLAISFLMFFLSWLMFHQAESSSKVFEEIDILYFSAKKAKTKEELTETENKYKELRKKCQHQGHYALMKTIHVILETKKEYL